MVVLIQRPDEGEPPGYFAPQECNRLRLYPEVELLVFEIAKFAGRAQLGGPLGRRKIVATIEKDTHMPFILPNYFKKIDKIFGIFVIFPTIISIVYFGLLASDVYISESRYVVRSPEKASGSALGMVLASAGFANASEEANAAKSFVESRDSLRAINKGDAFKKAYVGGNISFIDRFYGSSFEDLYKYYMKRVKVEDDVVTSISTLTVRAYTAEDAYRINEQLLEMAEQTINRMNLRGRRDMIRFAQVEVDDAQDRAGRAGVTLAAFRSREGVVDPELQATTQMTMIAKLQDEVIATRTQLSQLRAFTPLNPQISSLENRSESLQQEIRKLMSGLTDGDRSLAVNAVKYQKLFLEQQFADKQLAAALASLQEARNEARRQQVYVERIALPNKPDAPLEPRRLRGVFATIALGLVAWGIASMLVAGVKEHAQ
jgi:capsular polysaccharide transport system permease protein